MSHRAEAINLSPNTAILAALLASILIAFAGGGLIALAGPVFGALLTVFVAGLALVFHKEGLLYFGMGVALVVSGLMQLYYPPLGFVRWVIPIAAGGLFLHILIGRFGASTPTTGSLPWTLRWALLFLLTALVGSIAQWRGGLNFVQGIKLYFQLWGLLFGLTLIHWRPATMDGLLKVMAWVALLQLPFVLQQYLFIVPERAGLWRLGVVPVDVVAGTLGADRFGGGRNAVLSMYLVAAFGILASLWRCGALRGFLLALSTPVLLAPLFLNESKFALILVLLTLAYLFRADILRNPLRFSGAALVAAALALGMLASYSASFGKGKSIHETIQYTLESNVGAQGYASHSLNRWTVLTFWAAQHGLDDIPGTVFGHGLGASHESSESVLSAARTLADTRYRGHGIGLTAISALLWDTGLLGTCAILAMFASAFLLAGRLARAHADDRRLSGLFDGMQAAVLSAGLMLFHSNYLVLDPVFQTLVYFMFGYLGYWSLRTAASDPMATR